MAELTSICTCTRAAATKAKDARNIPTVIFLRGLVQQQNTCVSFKTNINSKLQLLVVFFPQWETQTVTTSTLSLSEGLTLLQKVFAKLGASIHSYTIGKYVFPAAS